MDEWCSSNIWWIYQPQLNRVHKYFVATRLKLWITVLLTRGQIFLPFFTFETSFLIGSEITHGWKTYPDVNIYGTNYGSLTYGILISEGETYLIKFYKNTYINYIHTYIPYPQGEDIEYHHMMTSWGLIQ